MNDKVKIGMKHIDMFMSQITGVWFRTALLLLPLASGLIL